MNKEIFNKIIPSIALFKLFTHDLTTQNTATNTIRFFAKDRIINFKGKDLNFNGCNYRIVERGNNNPENNSLTLKREKSNDLIEVFIVIKKVTENIAKFYTVIDSEKHLVKLSAFLKFKSNGNKEYILRPTNGGYYKNDDKVMHCNHYSHYSHRSSFPKD
jgi:hypothetical protein